MACFHSGDAGARRNGFRTWPLINAGHADQSFHTEEHRGFTELHSWRLMDTDYRRWAHQRDQRSSAAEFFPLCLSVSSELSLGL